ncbi:MAG: diguanylate cyclase [Proteobacteria bacterium]|nr:diguanylate cyclase [Pseudomonadota bacterium]MBU4014302.1 diguanylate cyclase [Pseudomonadota bacterium]MBU4068536.1 diguanylate cyclase [Pseudomonadota bacterium]MBU4102120.1 diguanylate cyclase [Pseudomonadota bacterium]MBU4126591.1 diguanylate cyclase [Pseudomonadota bacterium]
MKIAFPINNDLGTDSQVFNHFGSAKLFIVVETEHGEFELVVNEDRDHQHGHCQPLSALGGNSVDAVVVGGIGGGALKKLMSAGIIVYRAVEGSVQENLELIQKSRLPQFTLDQTCAGHSISGGCIH